jgi:hypothetical protein
MLRRFGVTYCLHVQRDGELVWVAYSYHFSVHPNQFSRPEYRGSTLLRNVSKQFKHHMCENHKDDCYLGKQDLCSCGEYSVLQKQQHCCQIADV